MTLQEAMVEFRAKNKLSQTECAKRIGVAYGTWQGIESGTRKPSKVNEWRIKHLIESKE